MTTRVQPRVVAQFLCVMLVVASSSRAVFGQGRNASSDGPPAVDYLTFAQGAVPVSIGGTGSSLGANFEHAVRIIDGDMTVSRSSIARRRTRPQSSCTNCRP